MQTGNDISAALRPLDLAAPALFTAFLKDTAAFALEDGNVAFSTSGDTRSVAAHPDAGILVAAAEKDAVLTGGDDGRVVRTRTDGTTELLGETGGSWIDALSSGPDGAVAWSSGKKVSVRDRSGALFTTEVPSSGRGLAFVPKGFQLAISHYNGVSLWFPRTATPPRQLSWKGSHIDITVAPDARFVVTTMQENALHGWRVADGANMRMSGYPSKTRSLAWSPDGKWLATSGADAAIVWPFVTKDGPMGKPPLELGVRRSRVERVAFHPKAPVVAVGYADGCILLIETGSGQELLARRENADSGAIAALAWDGAGMKLAFATRGGAAGVVELPKV